MTAAKLTSGRVLARNAVLNLLGHLLPMLVALLTIPLLVQGLGTERFGVLALAWVAIGYFSLFDFGLGRALTQLVAERLGSESVDTVPRLTWTGLALMFALGLLGGLALLLSAEVLVERVLTVPPGLRQESVLAFRWLAIALPFVIATAGLRGVLEAWQRFDIANAIRVPLGVLNYVGPLLALSLPGGLVPVIAVLALVRILTALVHLACCVRVVPGLGRRVGVDLAAVRPLLRFGGWMTVSNLISPIMVYFDRFFLGAVLSLAAVAYYATPYEMVTRLLVIPGALLGVAFPAFATLLRSDRARMAELFDQAVRAVFLILFPVVFVLVLYAPEALTLWLGPEFGRESTGVLRWLAVGVFCNSLAYVPFAALQGAGRPDLTGKLHLLELPLFLALLWTLTLRFGIEGTALAWATRVGLDMVLLFGLVRHLLPETRRSVAALASRFAAAGLALALAAILAGPLAKGSALLLVAAGFTALAWMRILTPAERAAVRAFLPGSRRAPAVRLTAAERAEGG